MVDDISDKLEDQMCLHRLTLSSTKHQVRFLASLQHGDSQLFLQPSFNVAMWSKFILPKMLAGKLPR